MAEPATNSATNPATAALLDISGLDLFYGDAQALTNISMQVPDKGIVAVVGANGAGKTSLIRAIAGIEKPRAGTIRFKGTNIAGLPSHAICELGIGQVAEGRQIFPSMSVAENLEMGGLLKRARAHANRTMEDVFTLFPRLKERIHQAACTLSGGEQQMLAIARALMSKPKFLMLDEPSLGIAPRLVKSIFQTIVEINRTTGLTILLVEQNANLALQLSSHAYVLETGQILLQGPSPDLKANPQVQAAYLGI